VSRGDFMENKFNRNIVELILFASSVGYGDKMDDAYAAAVKVAAILEDIHNKKNEEQEPE
jgi:hypothetical protein